MAQCDAYILANEISPIWPFGPARCLRKLHLDSLYPSILATFVPEKCLLDIDQQNQPAFQGSTVHHFEDFRPVNRPVTKFFVFFLVLSSLFLLGFSCIKWITWILL